MALVVSASYSDSSRQLDISWCRSPTIFSFESPQCYWITVHDDDKGKEWIISKTVSPGQTVGLELTRIQVDLMELGSNSSSYKVSVKGIVSSPSSVAAGALAYKVVKSGCRSTSAAATARGSLDSIMGRLSLAAPVTSEVNVTATVHGPSQLNATVSWTRERVDKWRVSVKNLTWMQNNYWYHECIYDVDADATGFQLPLKFRPGNRYRTTVRGIRRRLTGTGMTSGSAAAAAAAAADETTTDVLFKGSTEFRTGEVMPMSEMRSLMQTAVNHVRSSGASQCTWFYRNKTKEYFSKITDEHGGVMKTYLKDASGDLRAPINGEINGLFFMSKVLYGEPQPQSPFGDTRVLVRADILLDLAPNVYFADFYCLNGKDHYVTLVLSRAGSDADKLCQYRLPRLTVYDQSSCPFLFQSGRELYVSSGAMVELFFTEDLVVDRLLEDRDKARMVYNVPTFGPGRTSQGGRAKHSRCAVCRTQSLAILAGSIFPEY